MVYWYNSTSYRDDLTWAAAWLYKATNDPGYLSDAYAFWTEHTNQEGIWDLRYLVSNSAKQGTPYTEKPASTGTTDHKPDQP